MSSIEVEMLKKNKSIISEVTKIEIEENILCVEIKSNVINKDSKCEFIVLKKEEIVGMYVAVDTDNEKASFKVDLTKFIFNESNEYKLILNVDNNTSKLDLSKKITIEKILVENNEFKNKVIVILRNGKFKIKTTTLTKLRPEALYVNFDEGLYVEGCFRNDIKLLQYSNLKVKLKVISGNLVEEFIKDLHIEGTDFKFEISKEEVLNMNKLFNGKWNFDIEVIRGKEVLSSEYILFLDGPKEIFREEVRYDGFCIQPIVYLTKNLKRLALRFYNPISINKVLKIYSKKKEVSIRIRTKKNIVEIFENLNTAILIDGKEFKSIRNEINGKKTFTVFLKLDKENLNNLIDNGFEIKEIIGEETYIEKVKEIDKENVILNFKDKVFKSKRYKKLLIKLYKILLTKLPVKKKKVLFESFLGRNSSGNPKYIYEYMVNEGLDKEYELIWFFNNTDEEIIGKGKKIKRKSLAYYYHLATAKYWIFNTRQPNFVIKRNSGVYLQTWHGTPLKKLAMDMDSVNMGGLTDIDKYKETFYANSRRWDLLISQNDYSTEIFKSAFAFDKEILDYGYPANDILYNKNNKKDIDKIKEKFNLPKDKKVILYAPTWRDNSFIKKGHYKMDIQLKLDKMQKALGDEYIVLLRMHYLIMNAINISEFEGFVYDFSQGFDIQELYLVSDMLITDYSSVMFDYSNLKRDILFFAYDIEDYRDSLRGFYFDFEKEAPGPIIKNTDEVIESILNIEEVREVYKEKSKVFYDKFCHIDNGKASERVVNRMFKS